MDTLWIAATGTRAVLARQDIVANNLANVNTNGFRGSFAEFRALPVYGGVLPSNVYVAPDEPVADLRTGAINATGRALDVAIKGSGWLAVQAPDGGIAYTRNGQLQISSSGLLTTSDGHPVLGQDRLPITLPVLQEIQIGKDGTVAGIPAGGTSSASVVFNRLLLVDPPAKAVQRGDDGLFRVSGEAPEPDARVQLEAGALEGSNVNAVSTLIQMIENSRAFEVQTKLMHTVDQNAQAASQLLVVN